MSGATAGLVKRIIISMLQTDRPIQAAPTGLIHLVLVPWDVTSGTTVLLLLVLLATVLMVVYSTYNSQEVR
jgi:hypothetical protein